MSATFKVEAIEFGQAITPVTGTTTINSLDYGVAMTVEKITEAEDGTMDAQSVVMTMTIEQAHALAKDLTDATALAKFKQFMAKVRGQE